MRSIALLKNSSFGWFQFACSIWLVHSVMVALVVEKQSKLQSCLRQMV